MLPSPGILYCPKVVHTSFFFPVEVATNRVFNFSMLLVLVESCNLYKETLTTSSFSNKCCYKFLNVEHISGRIKNVLVDFKYVQMMH
jgi:hypothetical protein